MDSPSATFIIPVVPGPTAVGRPTGSINCFNCLLFVILRSSVAAPLVLVKNASDVQNGTASEINLEDLLLITNPAGVERLL